MKTLPATLLALASLMTTSWAKSVSSDFSGNQLFSSSKSNFFGSCSETHSLKICLKMKSLVLLEDLTVKDSPINLFGNSLTLIKNGDSRSGGGRMIAKSEEELDSSLPKEEAARDVALDGMISTTLEKFASSRALQIRLPNLEFLWSGWKDLEEARKRKGAGGLGWAFAMSGGMFGALGLGAIAMLAGKALMVSMMALMLAALSALKKGGGGGDHGSTTYEVINVPTGHGHHGHARSLARSLETGVDLPGGWQGAELAYRAHRPRPNDSETSAEKSL